MKAAVIKMALKVEELLQSQGKDLSGLASRIMLTDIILILHGEEIITNEQLCEAMNEVDVIYPSK